MSRKNRSIPSQKGNQNVQLKQAQFYQGPIPTPEMLNHYNQIQPDFAERIMLMAEKEQARTIKNEEETSRRAYMVITWGLIFAFLSVGGLIYALIQAIIRGYSSASIIVISIAAVGGIFIYKKYNP